jgi:hypothetical protein
LNCFDPESCEICRQGSPAGEADDELRRPPRGGRTSQRRRLPDTKGWRRRRPLWPPRPWPGLAWLFSAQPWLAPTFRDLTDQSPPNPLRDVTVDTDPVSGFDAVPDPTDRAEPDQETLHQGEVIRIASWSRLEMPKDLPKLRGAPGVYIIMRPLGATARRTESELPIYVGESLRLRDRWVGRMQGLSWLQPNIGVWFGYLQVGAGKEVGLKARLRAVEHSLVRILKSKGLALANHWPSAPFRVDGAELKVTNVLPPALLASPRLVGVPGLRNGTFTIRKGEMSPELEPLRFVGPG